MSPAPASWHNAPGLWKYDSNSRPRGILAFSIVFSVGLHLAVLYGFNHRATEKKHVIKDDSDQIQMVMPELKDLDEDKPVEELNDDQVQAPAVSVPTLIDLPTSVPVDSFVQPLDFHPPTPPELSAGKAVTIPVHVARTSSGEKLGKIFDLGQLDRVPEPVVQQPPVFPPGLKKDVSEAVVVVEFIVTYQGEVIAPHVIDSTHHGFDEAAMIGVTKWKFRPGVKAGKKVNTRCRNSIRFRIVEDN